MSNEKCVYVCDKIIKAVEFSESIYNIPKKKKGKSSNFT